MIVNSEIVGATKIICSLIAVITIHTKNSVLLFINNVLNTFTTFNVLFLFEWYGEYYFQKSEEVSTLA